jgi:hypothetical protein
VNTRALILIVSLAAVACGSSTPAPAPAPTTHASPTHDAATPPPKVPGSAAPAAATAALDSDEDDPNESAGPIDMEVVLGKGTPKSAFPKPTLGDRACWSDIGLTGNHDKDYAEVIAKCGAPTGMLEYAKPRHGRLHNIEGGNKKDPRDTYRLKLRGGLCYRYFAVGDGTIVDMDILVMTATGALVANDKTKSPVAIIHNDKPWCVDDDIEYNFNLDVDGMGRGHYIFAVWARPK